MPRFVLLRHECPLDYEKPSHWDFMLEVDGALRTWDLRELPTQWEAILENSRDSTNRRSTKVTNKVTALPLLDHRIAYLDYEGPLTENRGSVTRCDTGTFKLLDESRESLTIALSGTRLQGTVQLKRQPQAWSLELINEAS